MPYSNNPEFARNVRRTFRLISVLPYGAAPSHLLKLYQEGFDNLYTVDPLINVLRTAKPSIWHFFQLLSDFDTDFTASQNSLFLKQQVSAERLFAAIQKWGTKLLKSRTLCHSEEISMQDIFVRLALTRLALLLLCL